MYLSCWPQLEEVYRHASSTSSSSSKSPELELRINTYTANDHYRSLHCLQDHVTSGVPELFFTIVKSRLDAQQRVTIPSTPATPATPSASVTSSSIKAIEDQIYVKKHHQSEYRRIVSSTSNSIPDVFQLKQTLHQHKFEIVTSFQPQASTMCTPVRLVHAEETTLTAPEYYAITAASEVLSRTRQRWSYPHEFFVVDLTRVVYANTDEASYHVEVEFDLKKLVVTETFQHACLTACGLLFPLVSTVFDRAGYLPYKALSPSRGRPPVNIQTIHIQQGLKDYYTTSKIDGTAYSLFVLCTQPPNTFTLVAKNDTDCWVIQQTSLELEDAFLKSMEGLVNLEFRAEVIRGAVERVFLFDVRSMVNKQHFSTFTDRLEWLEETVSLLQRLTAVPIVVKTFRKTSSFSDDVHATLDDMKKTVGWAYDGLVFQPDAVVGTSVPPQLKWKEQHKISIDFLLSLVPEIPKPNTVAYVLKVRHEQDLKKFVIPHPVSKKLVPALLSFSTKHHTALENYPCTKLNNLIVECRWRSDQHTFKLMRIRWDKTQPNYESVANDTFYDMLHERTVTKLIEEVEQARLTASFSALATPSAPSVPSTSAPRLPDANRIISLTTQNQLREEWFVDADNVYETQLTPVTMKGFPSSLEQACIVRMITQFHRVATSIVDLTSGVGCLAIMLAKRFKHVYASPFASALSGSKSPSSVLQHNVRLYRKRVPGQLIVLEEELEGWWTDWDHVNRKVDVLYYDQVVRGAEPRWLLDVFSATSVVVIRTSQPGLVSKWFAGSTDLDIEVQTVQHKRNTFGTSLVFVCLKGFAFRKMRDRHNALKSFLISTFCTEKDVLDLGTGRGGDLFKYAESKTRLLACVEPNLSNLRALRDRINENASKFEKMDIKLIHKAAEQLLSSSSSSSCPQFQIISMFFSLTFFFRAEAVFSQLLHVIDKLLKRDGYLIGTTMVGNTLRRVLADGPIQTMNLRLQQTFTNEGVFGNEIEMDLKHTQTATLQTEYLVDWNEWCQRLASKGIYLVHTEYVDCQGLSKDEALVARYNVGFVFTKRWMGCSRQPCALGDASSSAAYRVPVHAPHDALYRFLLASCTFEESLRKFVYNNQPFEPNDTEMSLQHIDTLRHRIEEQLSIEQFMKTEMCRKIVTEGLLTGQIVLSYDVFQRIDKLTNLDDILRVVSHSTSPDDVVKLSTFISDHHQLLIDACRSYDLWKHDELLQFVCDTLHIDVSIFNAKKREWNITTYVSDNTDPHPVLRLCVHEDVYELVVVA